MAAVNYYYGVKRGAPFNPNNVVVGTSTAGTAVDIEVRVQINDGVNATKVTKLDVYKAFELIEALVKNNGINHNGTNIPAL